VKPTFCNADAHFSSECSAVIVKVIASGCWFISTVVTDDWLIFSGKLIKSPFLLSVFGMILHGKPTSDCFLTILEWAKTKFFMFVLLCGTAMQSYENFNGLF